jgi:hypothetical protein
MNTTKRVFWPQAITGWHNYNWLGLSSSSVVFISASEGVAFSNQVSPVGAFNHRRGDAVVSVKNINPHEANGGGVEFYLVVEWGAPLDVTLDITLFDPPALWERA